MLSVFSLKTCGTIRDIYKLGSAKNVGLVWKQMILSNTLNFCLTLPLIEIVSIVTGSWFQKFKLVATFTSSEM
jgi:hypothetical protein